MAVVHTFMAGTAIAYQRSLFFDLMESGDVYIGFARSDPMWGFASLLKIRTDVANTDQTSRTWPTGIMGQANGGVPDSSTRVKFYDKNSSLELLAGEVPAGSDRVYIGFIDKNSDDTDWTNFTILDTNDVGTLFLDYMNEEWAQIRGLNTDFFQSSLIDNSVTTNDYYLFNYDSVGDPSSSISRAQIETVTKVTLPSIETPVQLMYSTTVGAAVPTTAFGSNVIGVLTKSNNIFGEQTISGLKESFVTEGNGYVADNNLTTATFFLTTTDGVVIQDEMKYIETETSSTEISLIFSFPIVGEASQNSGRFKITTTLNPDKLALFTERFSDGTTITDKVPPPLSLNYLKIAMFHTSIFDVQGLTRIEAADVDFARRIDNTDTEALLSSVNGIDILTDIDLITLDDNPDTTVKYAITNNTSIARRYYFDLVRIKKTLTSTQPTDQVYRQMFICYMPKDSVGVDLDISTSDFTHIDLFQNTATNWGYDLGTILFLTNKEPVFRKYLSQDEDFTLLV